MTATDLALPVRAAMVEAVGRLLADATVRVVTDRGAVLSEHEVSGVSGVVGDTLWATVAPSIATGTGRADHIDIRALGVPLVVGGTLTLDSHDIDEGSDVMIDTVRVEARP